MPDMTPLAALIAECKQLFLDAHGVELTNGDIARRSGGRLTRQRVQQYATGDRSMPTPETVKGFSLGLQVPSSVVLQRALETAGYIRGSEPDAASTMTDPAVADLAARSAQIAAAVREPTRPARNVRPKT